MARRFIRNITSDIKEKAVIKSKKVKQVLMARTKIKKGYKLCKVCYKQVLIEETVEVRGNCFPYFMCRTHMLAGISGLRET